MSAQVAGCQVAAPAISVLPAVAPQRSAHLCQRLRQLQRFCALRQGLPGGAQQEKAGAGCGAAVAAPSLQSQQASPQRRPPDCRLLGSVRILPLRPRPRDRLQFDQVSRSNRDLDYPPRCCHPAPTVMLASRSQLQHVGPLGGIGRQPVGSTENALVLRNNSGGFREIVVLGGSKDIASVPLGGFNGCRVYSQPDPLFPDTVSSFYLTTRYLAAPG